MTGSCDREQGSIGLSLAPSQMEAHVFEEAVVAWHAHGGTEETLVKWSVYLPSFETRPSPTETVGAALPLLSSARQGETKMLKGTRNNKMGRSRKLK
jgi:hypothetical protein